MTKKAKAAPSRASCDCQWDDHFDERPVPGTVRHAYGATVPQRDLQQVGTFEQDDSERPILKCGPCRAHHNTRAFLRRLVEMSGRR